MPPGKIDIFRFPKNRFFRAPRKAILSVIKICFFRASAKKAIFSDTEKSLFQVTPIYHFSVSEKSLFQCVSEICLFPKNRFIRAQQNIDFFGFRKIAFTGRLKKDFFGFRQIVFSRCYERAFCFGFRKIALFSLGRKSGN